MATTKLTIGEKEYELKWNVGALLRFQKIEDDNDTDMLKALKMVFAMLPAGTFASVDDMADNIEFEQMDEIGDALAKVTESAKKKKQ